MQKQFTHYLRIKVGCMNNLINYKNSNPYKFCFLIFLYAIGAASLPAVPEQLFNIKSLNLCLILFFVLKFLTVIFPLYIIKSVDYSSQFKFRCGVFFKSCIVLLPLIIVCVNNFPIIALITNSAKMVNKGITYLYYILACLSIAVYEEVIFRGIIYNVIKEKKKDFWAIIISSLIFSTAHLINAFSLSIGYLLMQLGYSFLIGAMCCVAYKFSNGIYLPIILHFIYDIGGLLLTYELVEGNIWNITSIIITAIIAVIVTVYTVILYFVKEKNESSSSEG